jgi:hypothetical protein
MPPVKLLCAKAYAYTPKISFLALIAFVRMREKREMREMLKAEKPHYSTTPFAPLASSAFHQLNKLCCVSRLSRVKPFSLI